MATRLASTRLEQATTALFVCDIQEKFVNAIHGFSHMANGSAKVIRGATILNVPIFTTEQNPKALGPTVSILKDHIPSKDSPIIAKTRFSMVLPSGETEEFLKSKNIKSVMIVGIESHVCVLQTCLDLLAKGYGVWILRDCVSSCNKEEVPIAIEVRFIESYRLGSMLITAT